MNPEIVRPNIVDLGEVLWDVFPDMAHCGMPRCDRRQRGGSSRRRRFHGDMSSASSQIGSSVRSR